jgi:hypothetical protein
MLHEFGCNIASANAPLSYSPDSDGSCDGGRHCSPKYRPILGPPSTISG